MRREIRIGLLLAAAACLVAVVVDWAVEELATEETTIIVAESPDGEGEPPVAVPVLEVGAEEPVPGPDLPS